MSDFLLSEMYSNEFSLTVALHGVFKKNFIFIFQVLNFDIKVVMFVILIIFVAQLGNE